LYLKSGYCQIITKERYRYLKATVLVNHRTYLIETVMQPGVLSSWMSS